MRVAVTGTPGTGKTTAVERADTDLDVVHLNDVIEREGFDAGTDDDDDISIAVEHVIQQVARGGVGAGATRDHSVEHVEDAVEKHEERPREIQQRAGIREPVGDAGGDGRPEGGDGDTVRRQSDRDGGVDSRAKRTVSRIAVLVERHR